MEIVQLGLCYMDMYKSSLEFHFFMIKVIEMAKYQNKGKFSKATAQEKYFTFSLIEKCIVIK